ncbi:MAG: T9SS type A sorting domain-containing protein [Ferruginibacter sp.]
MEKNLHAIFYFLIFLLLVFNFQNISAQGLNRVDIGKSFANLSKLSTGGTFNPGDTVEVRVTIAVITQGTFTTIDSVQVFDQVPAKTTYINGSMRIATNQGLTYKGPFSEPADADAGQNIAGNIIINLGRGANGIKGGRIRSDSSRPSFYNSHCIMMAVYRVRINAATAYGDTIFVNGSVRFKRVVPLLGWTNIAFPNYKILVFNNNGYCANGSDISAASDANGTFGSGNLQNRSAALLFGTTYIKQNVSTNSPQDYNYAIVNNSSANGSTNPNSTMPESPALNRVFGFWDIGGDHTGAVINNQGNPPVAPGTTAGYYVMVNASYNTNIAYQETLTNLCPNTYYEFSAWYRNLCPRCSCDSMGRGSGSPGFIPFTGNDSSGVRPNLNFEIDGLAYYTTGDIRYNRTSPWIKYGFTFLTKPGQTTANFAIRNNSPGGGGNDWAIDDIKVAHCGPSLIMNYSPYVLGCRENPFVVTLIDTVRSVYNNYTYFKWQRSNVGGTIWADMTGPGTSGVGVPVLVNGLYEYITALPPFLGIYADSGRYFRVIVATTAANLSSVTCAFNDNSSILLKVITCGTILTVNDILLKGQSISGGALLTWSVVNEENIISYEIEKSTDGNIFSRIDSMLSQNRSSYSFTDTKFEENNYYRIKLLQAGGAFSYSRIILISKDLDFSIKSIVNPFKNTVRATIIVPGNGSVTVSIINHAGQLIKSINQHVEKGYNEIITDPGIINNGMYILSIEFKNKILRNKLIRMN